MAANCSRSGTFRILPTRNRLILLLMKASGLARNRPTSICSSEIPSGLTPPATPLSVSPDLTVTWLAAAAGARAGAGAGAAAAAAGAGTDLAAGDGVAGAGAWATAGAAAVGATTGAVTAGAGDSMPGGSSSAEYSRETLPPCQTSSISRSRNGSATGRNEVALIYEVPFARRSTDRRSAFSEGLNCRFAA